MLHQPESLSVDLEQLEAVVLWNAERGARCGIQGNEHSTGRVNESGCNTIVCVCRRVDSYRENSVFSSGEEVARIENQTSLARIYGASRV